MLLITDESYAVVVLLLAFAAVVGYSLWRSARSAAQLSAERARLQAEREAFIYGKYGHTKVATDILASNVWEGQTAEQLRDTLGPPVDVDHKLTKKKSKEVWKYAPTGINRYAVRITLENGVVVGWDEKLDNHR